MQIIFPNYEYIRKQDISGIDILRHRCFLSHVMTDH